MILNYYHATRNLNLRFPSIVGPHETDVCVIGGGLTGISTALNLAERGYSVIVVEGHEIGYGASSRNGGQVVNGYSCEMDKIRQIVGLDISKKLWDLGLEAIADLDFRIDKHRISCDRRSGYLFAAKKSRQFKILKHTGADWQKLYGYNKIRLIDRDEIPNFVRTKSYTGGLLDAGSGQIHPLNYLEGLTLAATDAGVAIFEHSPVFKIKLNTSPQIETPNGKVKARVIVLAGNAYHFGLVPELDTRTARLNSFVGTTKILTPSDMGDLIPANIAIADCDTALDYYRITEDGRLLFGTGANISLREPKSLEKILCKRIQQLFPHFNNISIEYAWSGRISITRNRMPDIGHLKSNIYYAQGFSGHGIALSGLVGKLIAEAISGETGRFELFSATQHKLFPNKLLRGPILSVLMSFRKLIDQI